MEQKIIFLTHKSSKTPEMTRYLHWILQHPLKNAPLYKN